MESDSSLLREKFDQIMHTKEAMTMKTLEAKLAITEKKKEVKLAKVEACLKPFFTGQGACRGDHRPYLQPVKQVVNKGTDLRHRFCAREKRVWEPILRI
jgi:hypothetical protein